MDDKPTHEEPKKDFNKLDLSQLESFSFGTQWTQDQPESGGGTRGRDDRPRRDGGPRDARKDRRVFKRPAGGPGETGEVRGPRGEGGPPRTGDRRGRDRGPERSGDRGGERQFGGERGGERRFGQEGGPGGGRGPGGPRGDRRRGGPGGPPVPMGPYLSPYFDVTFYPEDVSFAALAKTIRASCRTFELFDIAKTVIGKPDRFVVVLERKPPRDPAAAAEKKPFYVSVPDSLPFETEEAAINHVMQHHVGKFFRSDEVEVDPPKGSFQVINKCGVTGELLGPPNYHLYNQIVQQHHAARLSRMPLDAFRSRIESVRDEAVVNTWLESMKRVTRFTWIGSGDAARTGAGTPADPEVPVAAPDGETEAAEAITPEPTAPAAPSFDSLTEAKVFLLTHARDKAVRTYEHGRFHGHALDQLPDGEIKRAVIGALERQQRFPLDTANALRGRLRREGFTIFKKGSKGVSFVCAVKRKFRVPGQTFADSIDRLITFIETHPMVKVSELPERFLGLKPAAAPAPSPATVEPVESPAVEATETEATETVPSPAPAPAGGTVSPFAAADQPTVKRMQFDLRWLVTEGYVTEFIDGSLFASPPLPEAKPKSTPSDTADSSEEVEEDPEPSADPEPAPAVDSEIGVASPETTAAPEPVPAPEPPTATEEPVAEIAATAAVDPVPPEAEGPVTATDDAAATAAPEPAPEPGETAAEPADESKDRSD